MYSEYQRNSLKSGIQRKVDANFRNKNLIMESCESYFANKAQLRESCLVMSECGKILKIQDWLGDLCSLELYELIYIFIEMLRISSFSVSYSTLGLILEIEFL